MLNWEKIDNEKTFQRLVNDLFALEVGKPGYKPSSPYIGPDGSWDGRFEGDYSGLSGMFSVQSKWTTHTLNSAYDSLHSDIKGHRTKKGELTKAQEKNVDHLFVATNAELRVGTDDHVGKLEALNTGGVQTLVIYYREKLRPLIEKYPWLLHKYFGVPLCPLFATYSEYSSTNEPDLFMDSALLARSKEIEQIKSFVADNKQKILMVYAPGGCGKSRFLIEVAELIQETTHGKWQSWFCRPSLRAVEDAFQDEIHKDRSYLLFLDNAEMSEDVAKLLITALKSFPASKVKLIVSCRTPTVDIVSNWITDVRLTEHFSKLKLGELSEEEAIELLRTASTNMEFKNPERIVRYFNNNPYFIIFYAKYITGEAPPELLKSKNKNLLESGAKTLVSLGFTSVESNALLCELSAIVPFILQKGIIIQCLAKIVTKTEEITIAAIEKLVEDRLLRYVGASIRFRSDMNGNVYLSTVLDEANGERIADELFERWLPITPDQIASNIAAAARNSQSSNANEASSRLIQNMVATADSTDVHEKTTILSWVKYLVALAPEPVADLLSTYLANQSDPNEIGGDYYGPIILRLSYIPGFQEQALNLIRVVEGKSIVGASNYDPSTLVRSTVSPIQMNSIDTAISSLQTLDSWADSECDDQASNLIIHGVKEALGGSHEYSESYGAGITFGRQSLVYSPKVDEYRNVAMGVYKKIFFKDQASIQVKSISAFGNIGHDASEIEGPFWERILRDKQEALDWIASLLSSDSISYAVLAEIEDTLMCLWTNEVLYPDLSIQAEELLSKINRAPEFLVYKLFTARDFSFSDFETIRKSAPYGNRWSWLVDNHFHLDCIEPADLSGIIEPLSEKYITSCLILDYLTQLNTSVGGAGSGYVPLIETWAKHNTTVIIEIIENPDLISKVPERFKDGFHSVAAKEINTYIGDFAMSLIAQSPIPPTDVRRLINLIIQNNIRPNVFMEWMTRLISKLDNQCISVVLNQTYYMFHGLHKNDQKFIVDLIELILDIGITEKDLKTCDFLIRRMIKEEMAGSRDLSKIKDKIFLVIKDAKRLAYHTNRLLELLIDNELENLLNFIEYRLRRNQESSYYMDAIPYEGFDFMLSLVKSFDDFNVLMNRIALWHKVNLISTYDIAVMLGDAKEQTDDVHGNYLVHYIDQNISTEDPEGIRNAFAALYALDFNEKSADTYLNALERAAVMGLLEEAKSVLNRNVLYGSFSSTLGKASPRLLGNEKALIAMKDKCKPGQLRSLIGSLEKVVNKDIQVSFKRGEEIINPKE